ncbi:hypothetical protein ACCT09_50755, partial [Rhizobium ruizarguesonis]
IVGYAFGRANEKNLSASSERIVCGNHLPRSRPASGESWIGARSVTLPVIMNPPQEPHFVEKVSRMCRKAHVQFFVDRT